MILKSDIFQYALQKQNPYWSFIHYKDLRKVNQLYVIFLDNEF